jgi:hypothetical protein
LNAANVHLPLEPLRDVTGAENLAAQRAEGLGRLLEPSLNVVVVRQVVFTSLSFFLVSSHFIGLSFFFFLGT